MQEDGLFHGSGRAGEGAHHRLVSPSGARCQRAPLEPTSALARALLALHVVFLFSL